MTYVIETIDLTKKFEEIIAVNNITMNIKGGQIVGLVGPNGAGKTTLFRILTGSIKPTNGTARINGWDVQAEGVKARRSLGYISEENSVYPTDMRGDKFVRYIAELKGLSREEAKRESYLTLKYVDMEQFAQRKIGTMSRGMKQRIGIAQALIGNPSILIADEPLAFLDPIGKQGIKTLLQQLVKEEKHTIFISSHILTEVEALVEDVGILYKGKIVSFGQIDDLLKSACKVFFADVDKLEVVKKELINLPSIEKVVVGDDGLYITTNDPEVLLKELPRIIASKNAALRTFQPIYDSLEKYFLTVINSEEGNSD
ncbi:MAG: ABC transporter ATP-binding protein [Candidatus Hodarchaeota archaeon]